MPTPASPLEGTLVPGEFGLIGRGGPGVSVVERRALSLVQIAPFKGKVEAAASALAERLGVASPREPNTAVTGETCMALWLGPDEWLLVADRMLEGELYRKACEAIGRHAAVVDQSHGRCVVRIGGPGARDVMAKGCPLDLHPRAFEPGRCGQSLIGEIPALVHQVDDAPSYDLYVFRGYARSFGEWLAAAAAEFGYRMS